MRCSADRQISSENQINCVVAENINTHPTEDHKKFKKGRVFEGKTFKGKSETKLGIQEERKNSCKKIQCP